MMRTSVNSSTPSFPQYPERRIPSRCAHDAASGMRSRSTHPEVADRRRVLRPSGSRTKEEQLLEGQLALKDVAFGEPELALEIERREHLPMQDDVANVRCMLGER